MTAQQQRQEPQQSMRVGMRTRDLSESRLRFMKQIGVMDVLVDPSADDGNSDTLTFTGESPPSVEELESVQERLQAQGQQFHAIHSIPISAYDAIMFDRPEKDEQLETLKQFVYNLGEVGVPILGYKWMAVDVQRTTEERPVRGGAEATAFSGDEADVESAASGEDRVDMTEEEMWENYETFVEEIMPVAEEADVRLAVHPADPPVYKTLGGIPSLFRSVKHYERAMELDDSPNHGIKLCLGCFSEMGADVYDVARTFVERGKVGFVHFRDVVGTVPEFNETFIDDPESNYDEYRMLETLEEAGFRGTVLTDHIPRIEGDEPWDPTGPSNSMPTPKGGPRARAFGAGYLRGMIKALRS